MTFPVNVMVSNWNHHAHFPPNLSAIYNHLTVCALRAPLSALGRTKDKRAAPFALSIDGVGLLADVVRSPSTVREHEAWALGRAFPTAR